MATDVVMPRLSDSMEEGVILKWLVAEGDRVEEGQEIVEVETDKATVPYEAEVAGVVLGIVVPEGGTAAVGQAIALIGEPGEDAVVETRAAEPQEVAMVTAPSGPETPAAVAAAAGAQPGPPAPGTRVPASPLARRVASNLGVDLAALAGSGPGGRVVRADVEAALRADGAPVPAAQPQAAAPGAAKGEVAHVEPTRIQGLVARRMAESRATVPDFELRADVDMSRCVELRGELKAITGEPPSFNDLVVKACALALRELPRANGAYRDGRFELFSRVNVGVAVAADDALVVPTVHDADRLSLAEIGRATRHLAARVRDGQITPPELAGATFTVSNLGMYGVDSFTAVINPPQAAILAVGALRSLPAVADDGSVVARPTMTLTLACDHRILYGADGARLLVRIRELLEHPLALVL